MELWGRRWCRRLTVGTERDSANVCNGDAPSGRKNLHDLELLKDKHLLST